MNANALIMISKTPLYVDDDMLFVKRSVISLMVFECASTA